MKLKLVFSTALFVMLFQSMQSQEDSTKPNVLLIMCDDLNDYLGKFGGHPQAITPNLDKLAASGVQFLNAQTNVPVCSPSRNSFITGVYPHASKDYGWTDLKKQPVVKHNKTLIGYFKENGYTTLGTGKITHGSIREDWDKWGNPLGDNYGPFWFDGDKFLAHPKTPKPYSDMHGPAIDGSFGRLSTAGVTTKQKRTKEHQGWVYGWKKIPMQYTSDEDRDLMQDEKHTQWALNQLKGLEASERDKPFFMGVGYVRPHTPLIAPDKFFDMYPIEDLQLAQWQVNDDEDTYWESNINSDDKGYRYYKMLLESYGGDREKAIKHFLQAYLACVSFVDEQIGMLLDGLNDSKFSNNTIVIFTSDHGWQMGEKNFLFKNSPWEESARIPLVIKTPTSEPGVKVEQPVSLVDIFPTLKDVCHLKGDTKKSDLGGDLGGFSLKPLIEDNGKWEGPNGALTVVGNFGVGVPTEKQNFSYRTKNWRYIRYSDGKEELYNHKEDPYEWKNLAEDKKCKRKKRALQKEMDAIINNK